MARRYLLMTVRAKTIYQTKLHTLDLASLTDKNNLFPVVVIHVIIQNF